MVTAWSVDGGGTSGRCVQWLSTCPDGGVESRCTRVGRSGDLSSALVDDHGAFQWQVLEASAHERVSYEPLAASGAGGDRAEILEGLERSVRGLRCDPVVEHGAERDALGDELAEAADGADACEELFVAQVLGSEGAVGAAADD